MARKPIHLTMTGGKLPRQHMWEAIRSLSRDPKGLTTYNVARLSSQDDEAVGSYLRALQKAGIVERLESLGKRNARWKLTRDEGAEAPRVNKGGQRVPSSAVENVWRTLRILGALSAAEAAEHASVNGVTMTELAARTYLQGLTLAGYVTRTDGTPGKPARYHLVRQRYTGPQHPVYQRSTSNRFTTRTWTRWCGAKTYRTAPSCPVCDSKRPAWRSCWRTCAQPPSRSRCWPTA